MIPFKSVKSLSFSTKRTKSPCDEQSKCTQVRYLVLPSAKMMSAIGFCTGSVCFLDTTANVLCMNVENSPNADTESTYSQQCVPYCEDLTDLTIGTLISVKGTVQKRCRRFSINFLCSKDPNPDIAFHFNPRMEQRCVVRNCRINGYWGEEETSSVMTFDFARGTTFQVDIFVTEREFMVTVNGKHWCSFTYRLPLASIRAMEVRGLVDVAEVKLKELDSYPEVNYHCEDINVGDESSTKYTMPYLGKLSRPFDIGWELEISGRPKILPQNFYVNLQEEPQLWPHPNVPLHLNPRFCTSNGVDVFVRNAWYDGDWGQEERAPLCPFLAGTNFKFQIRHEYDSFTVWMDGGLIADFRFRNGVNRIQYVHIVGDVDIYNVALFEKNRDS